MACSKYQYVKKFQETHAALLQSYIVVRIDGKGFTKFCSLHQFVKPNDIRAIKLMNAAAQHVSYGQSDQYSFAFNKQTALFGRRTDKILSCVVSAFTGAYIFKWKQFFENEMKEIPSFDSRIVVYPNENCLKDYFRWRQVDCHINNLYNTTFWSMVGEGKSNTQVQNILKDTNSAIKNQILFEKFNINYNKIDEVYRRGTFLLYEYIQKQQIQFQKKQENMQKYKSKKLKKKRKLTVSHEDCIKEQFWEKLLQ